MSEVSFTVGDAIGQSLSSSVNDEAIVYWSYIGCVLTDINYNTAEVISSNGRVKLGHWAIEDRETRGVESFKENLTETFARVPRETGRDGEDDCGFHLNPSQLQLIEENILPSFLTLAQEMSENVYSYQRTSACVQSSISPFANGQKMDTSWPEATASSICGPTR